MGILGLTMDTEKEGIYIVVPDEQADHIFERVFVTAKMDTPGMGILWLARLEKMATHIPPDIAARSGVHTEHRE
jgi:nitrogen regulatory protein PII